MQYSRRNQAYEKRKKEATEVRERQGSLRTDCWAHLTGCASAPAGVCTADATFWRMHAEARHVGSRVELPRREYRDERVHEGGVRLLHG